MEHDSLNKLFPVFLKLENFRVLIIGGGKVGLEKVSAILNNSPQTKITLVATSISEEIKLKVSVYNNVILHQRGFVENDLFESLYRC